MTDFERSDVPRVPTTSEASPIDATEVPQPQSRRELRERERAAAAASLADRSAPRRSGKGRAAKDLGRRDVIRRGLAKERGSVNARTIGSRLFSFGAMIFAAALAIGTTVPANAIGAFLGGGAGSSAEATVLAAEAPAIEPQSVVVDGSAVAGSARDGWTVTSWAQILRERYGTRDYSYNASSMGPIRWPFPTAVPVSSGYGERVAPCRGCSTYHQGVDFNPGNGAAIFNIADGVVVQHEEGGGGFGNFVIIQHQIDGHTVESTYAHMQTGSSPLSVGQSISVGEFVGLVGSTGQATGPHLHLEITVDGVNVDPFAWLEAHAS